MSEQDGTQAAANNPEAGAPVGGESGDSQHNQVSGYITSFPEEVRGHELLSEIGNGVELFNRAKDYYDRYNAVKDRVVPGEGSTDEDWDAFRKLMGVPETKEGYEFQYPEDMDQNVVSQMGDWIREIAYEQGLPAKAVSAIFDRWVTDSKAAMAKSHTAKVQADKAREEALAEKFGSEWASKRGSVDEFIKSKLGEDMHKALSEMHALDNPAILGGFIDIAERTSEDKLPGGRSVRSGSGERSVDERLASLFPNTKYD